MHNGWQWRGVRESEANKLSYLEEDLAEGPQENYGPDGVELYRERG
jgi:hypothetical protein